MLLSFSFLNEFFDSFFVLFTEDFKNDLFFFQRIFIIALFRDQFKDETNDNLQR